MYKKSVFNSISRCNLRFSYFCRNLNSNASDNIHIEIPKPKREDESVEKRRSRLLYQSRKRGMLENDLLLSTFANKYLNKFSPELLDQYDKLINGPSNDWDLYYWLTGKEEPPVEFKNEVFDLLKVHTQNNEREMRCRQPALSDS